MPNLNNFLRYFNIQLHRKDSVKKEKEYYLGVINKISNFYTGFVTDNFEIKSGISGIVFSKDRAMQLHALLSSYFFYAQGPAPLTVLFTCSNTFHEQSYTILKESFSDYPVSFIKETDFKEQLRSLVKNTTDGRIFFMTDDAVFTGEFDLYDCMNFNSAESVFSLRLGADMDYCYTYQSEQAVPLFEKVSTKEKPFLIWKWDQMFHSPDWCYPLSVDATIFTTKEVERLIEEIDFRTPNTLEGAMQAYAGLFTCRNGVCYTETKYVNIPCNIVQNDYQNVQTGLFSADELLKYYMEGKRIKWKLYKGMQPKLIQAATFEFE